MASRTERTVEILYFAAIAELLDSNGETLVLPGEVTNVRELSEYLERVRPALRGNLRNVRFAVNETFADVGERVESGDVVAILPPVSGG